jgi:methionyl-tRNA formyltransferase
MLKRTILLATHGARTQSYAQNMARAGLALGGVLLYGDPAPAPGHLPRVQRCAGVPLADLSLPLEETCAQAGWPLDRVFASDVNHPEVASKLSALAPSLVIFSGAGGQIVKPPLLELGAPFLHAHSGWLPRYRGSTTIYYSILEERDCAVSVLLLNREIDGGPILARRRYPLPPPGIDVDCLYDAAIRADLLVQVLSRCEACGTLPEPIDVAGEEAGTYYVVHPVLKHLALLSLGGPEAPLPS